MLSSLSRLMPPSAAAAAKRAHDELHSSVTVGTVTTRLTVTVPQGISGGDLVRVAAPDGSYHSIMVPAGLTSGQQFSVELLAAGSAAGTELQRLKVRPHARAPIFFRLTPLGRNLDETARVASPTHLSPLSLARASPPSQMELDAERALRRETQQEALRSRSVRGLCARALLPCPPR